MKHSHTVLEFDFGYGVLYIQRWLGLAKKNKNEAAYIVKKAETHNLPKI